MIRVGTAVFIDCAYNVVKICISYDVLTTGHGTSRVSGKFVDYVDSVYYGLGTWSSARHPPRSVLSQLT